MRHPLFPAFIALALALTGCSTTVPSTPAPGSASPTSASSEPSAEDAAPTATCDTVLTDAEYADLAADGLTLNPDIFVLDATMQSLIDAGGLACYWTRTGGDVRVWFAQAALGPTEWDDQKQALIGEGWTETDTPVAGVIQAPTDNDDDYIPVMTYRDGAAYYASYADFLGSVQALQN
jgi:hypothetical protein